MVTAESVIAFICLSFSYLFSIIMGNFSQAWLARKWGASTEETEHYLTFNPLNHLNFYMMLPFLFWIGNILFNMSQYVLFAGGVPVATENIVEKDRLLKSFFVLTASFWVHFILGFAVVIVLNLLFNSFIPHHLMKGEDIISLSELTMVPSQNLLKILVQNLPHISSLLLIMTFILLCLAFCNVMLAAICLFFMCGHSFIKLWFNYLYPDQYLLYRCNFSGIQLSLLMFMLLIGNPFDPIIHKIIGIGTSLLTGN